MSDVPVIYVNRVLVHVRPYDLCIGLYRSQQRRGPGGAGPGRRDTVRAALYEPDARPESTAAAGKVHGDLGI